MSLPIPSPLPTAYETAFRVLNPAFGTQKKERRAVQRHRFRFVQRIASYDGEDSLARLRFFPVLCYDISRRGVSFLLPGRLGFSRLVVELGSNGDWMYFEAEVVNHRPLANRREDTRLLGELDPGDWVCRPVLIGCRFKSRLQLHPA